MQLVDIFGTNLEIEDIIFVLAHEIRHAQHKELGLYRQYYYKKKKCHHLTGLAAERDCDRFAGEFLEERKMFSYLCNRDYPPLKVSLTYMPKKWERERNRSCALFILMNQYKMELDWQNRTWLAFVLSAKQILNNSRSRGHLNGN